MVDCGGSYADDAADIAAATLLSQGVTRLDGLILTHYDGDHVGGAVYLLSRVPTKTLILPEGEDEKGFEKQLLAQFQGEVIQGDRDLQITWGDSKITVFASKYFEPKKQCSEADNLPAAWTRYMSRGRFRLCHIAKPALWTGYRFHILPPTSQQVYRAHLQPVLLYLSQDVSL